MAEPSAADVIGEIDFVIKTFLRPRCLARLVDSILARYPAAHLIIADDGDPSPEALADYERLRQQGHEVLLLPFDVGLSAGRNALVEHARRPFVLLLDDDFAFTESTRIETLVEVMRAEPSIGVAAGSLLDDGVRLLSYEYALRLEDGVLHYLPAARAPRLIGGHLCRDSDIVLNFALFRRELFTELRWDPALKVREHTDFFLGLARTPWKVVHVPSVVAVHMHEEFPEYRRYRESTRPDDYLEAKWGIAARVYYDGTPLRDRYRLWRAHLDAAGACFKRKRFREGCRWLLRPVRPLRG